MREREEVIRLLQRIILCTTCILASLVFCRAIAANHTPRVIMKSHMYLACGEIVELIEDYDLVTVETQDGNLWVFQGIEDWMPGDKVVMAMDDSATSDVSDDLILSVRYLGT